MDKLSAYIDSGKGKGFHFFWGISSILTLLISLFVYVTLSQIPHQVQVQKLLNEFPPVTIQNGSIIEPLNTLWTNADDFNDPAFTIDTRSEQPTEMERKDGIYLLKKHILIKVEDTIQTFPWPVEKTILTKQKLLDTFQDTLISITILIACVIFAILWIGLFLTTLLTHLSLWLIQRYNNRTKIARSAFIGWTSIVFLNVILITFGYGFSVLMMILLATIISVVGIFHTTQ